MTTRARMPANLIAPSPEPHYDPGNEAQFRRQVMEAIAAGAAGAGDDGTAEVQSISLSFDPPTAQLVLIVVAGRNAASIRLEISDQSDFSTHELDETVDVAGGDVVTRTVTLTPDQRRGTWYARATPYPAASGAGTAGRTAEAATSPGLGFGFVREVPTEDQLTLLGTLTLIPIDGAAFDTVQVSTQSGNNPWSAWAPVTADGSGHYVDTVALVEKHPSKIAYRVYVDSTIVQENVVTFDVGTIANVLTLEVAYSGGGIAHMSADFDSDTDVGLGAAEYRIDGGAWDDSIVVGADRVVYFDVTQTGSPQLVEVRGISTAGAPGPTKGREIESYTAPTPGPPAIESVTLAVIEINSGADDQYVVSTSTSGTVSGTDHALRIELFAGGGAAVHTEPAHDPTSGPLIQVEPAEAPLTEYWARVRLYKLADGAVLSDVTTIPVLRS